MNVCALLDASPHKVNAQETIEIGKQYDFLVLFTSTPGFQGDIKLAAAMKEEVGKIPGIEPGARAL